MTETLTDRLDVASLHRSMEDAITMIQHYAQNKSAARRCLITLKGILQLHFPQRNSEVDNVAFNPAFTGAENDQIAQQDFGSNGQATMGWAMSADEMQNAAVFGYFSDAWLTQPPIDLDFFRT